MRLLNVHTLAFKQFSATDDIPPYIITSHRWFRNGDELTYTTYTNHFTAQSPGHKKLKGFYEFIRKYRPEIEWLWIDTCCIDKTNQAELSKAITSMFKWYRNATECIVYLADVAHPQDFATSEWFTRGWTLQELLAPNTVTFVDRHWGVIGYKRGVRGGVGRAWQERVRFSECGSATLSAITAIPIDVLEDVSATTMHSVDDIMSWAQDRKTTEPEDLTYSLLGLFGVSMLPNYGEGHENARARLAEAISKRYAHQVHNMLIRAPSRQRAASHVPHFGTSKTKVLGSCAGATGNCGQTSMCEQELTSRRRECQYIQDTSASISNSLPQAPNRSNDESGDCTSTTNLLCPRQGSNTYATALTNSASPDSTDSPNTHQVAVKGFDRHAFHAFLRSQILEEQERQFQQNVSSGNTVVLDMARVNEALGKRWYQDPVSYENFCYCIAGGQLLQVFESGRIVLRGPLLKQARSTLGMGQGQGATRRTGTPDTQDNQMCISIPGPHRTSSQIQAAHDSNSAPSNGAARQRSYSKQKQAARHPRTRLTPVFHIPRGYGNVGRSEPKLSGSHPEWLSLYH